MKKFMYLSLTGLMVLSPTTNCMEQIITADKEAEIPSKGELINQFMEAALAVSTLNRYAVAESAEFSSMQEIYGTIKKVNNGNKEQTQAELLDGYHSGDEDYYKKEIENADKTLQKIRSIDAILAFRTQPKLADNQKKFEKLTRQQNELNESYKDILNKRANNKAELAKIATEKEVLEQARTILY